MATIATYVSSSSFTIEGEYDHEYPAGRKLKLLQGVDGTDYVVVTSSSYASGTGLTTVNVSPSTVTSNLVAIERGASAPESVGHHEHKNAADGKYMPASALSEEQKDQIQDFELYEAGDANKIWKVDSSEDSVDLTTIQGTTDQVEISFTDSTITISLPQDIATESSPEFAGLTLTGESGIIKAAAGALGGVAQLDHGTDLTGLDSDDHPQYVLKSTLDAKGKIYAASGDSTIVAVPAPTTNDHVLTADATEASGMKWAEAAAGSSGNFTITGTGGEALNQYELVYTDSADSGEWKKADSDNAGTAYGRGIVTASGGIGDGSTGEITLCGTITNGAWSFTPGAILYSSATAGGISESAGTVESIIGFAITATQIFLLPYQPGSGGGGVSDHGALTGLTDNDHPQYPLFLKNHYERSDVWTHGGTSTATQRRSVDSPDELQVKVDSSSLFTSSSSSYDLNSDGSWDFGQDIGTWAADTAYSEGDFVRPTSTNDYVYKCTTSGTSDSSEPSWGTTPGGTDTDNTAEWTCYRDDAVASHRAGVDYYIYACEPDSGTTPDIIISRNSTTPHGYTATNSRKIGGFHCLCASAGTISGHSLSDFLQGDVIPASLWDLKHRALSENEGMVYDEDLGIWVDIYLASGTGSSTASAYGGTISDTRNWMDFVDDGKAVKKRLLRDHEFQSIAEGSNQETNISGSADPVTTGGHSDTASRRMVSDIGCEDCCGAVWQWLDEQSYQADGTAWAFENLPGSKGSFYKQGTHGDVKLRAGGAWAEGSNCGSRARRADNSRWQTSAYLSPRFASNRRAT